MTVIWELDFYSRPILDERGKKLWEALICESSTDIHCNPSNLFRFAKFCANTEVNSVWLREAIEEAIAQAPAPPDRIRFFRRQMTNMITKACEDAGLPIYASRRTLVLSEWLQERMATVYPTFDTYQPGDNPSVSYPPNTPQALPDALRGDRWTIASLAAEELADLAEWDISFGEAFPLDLVKLDADAPIPGLIIYSSRDLPLAAWMSGLELAFLKASPDEAGKSTRLLLETGANEAWILATLTAADLQQAAQAFEAAKQQAQNVHFLAVQSSPEAETFAGFWLLKELNLA
ncbi:MAG: Tab2/Atab2 family RNA-binding protein [Synechococcales bacterium]|nr:Tab2/Atab2 family RNA-binding protein [Synechococcales bacterium]